jgi:hypothetical protein
MRAATMGILEPNTAVLADTSAGYKPPLVIKVEVVLPAYGLFK